MSKHYRLQFHQINDLKIYIALVVKIKESGKVCGKVSVGDQNFEYDDIITIFDKVTNTVGNVEFIMEEMLIDEKTVFEFRDIINKL